VPLSDHEQRQLELIEQALYADDPKLARAVRAQDPRVHFKRRVIFSTVIFAVGACLLAAGLVLGSMKHAMPGIAAMAAGAAVMLAGGIWALASWRHLGAAARRRSLGVVEGGRVVRGVARGRGKGPGRRRSDARLVRGSRPGTPFMERMEERWRRRQDRNR
jgi:hypothetical protein